MTTTTGSSTAETATPAATGATSFTNVIGYERDGDIVTLVLDDPRSSVNTISVDFVASLQATLARLREELDDTSGIIVASAKRTFLAGGDLGEILAYRPEDAEAIAAHVTAIRSALRSLETIGKPVVSAIGGTALGGGLELALATHHRIMVDARGVVVGLPEVGFGLLPAIGGISRTVRMIGIVPAVNEVATSNKRFGARDALALGLVDDVVDSVEELLPAARAWLASSPEAVQPWDRPGFRIPGGTPADPEFASILPSLPANLRKKLKGVDTPAPRAILSAAVEGSQVDFDAAGIIDVRYFVSIASGRIAKNLIRSGFFELQEVNAGASRPVGPPPFQARKVGVLGAGMMGAGIAYVSAKAGIDVVLKDVSLEAADRGRRHSEKLLESAVARGTTTAARAQEVLGRITATADPADFAGVDFVVEAVFESVEVKHGVFREIEHVVEPTAILGSNTSTLPITTLAEGVERAEDFIGVHFFSPVDRMPLIEIIVGARTSDSTLARAFDFARQIGKTPIVVRDSRGFFTSRVIMTYLHEAAAALGEGVDPATIEQAGLQAGYPAGPLQLLDELTLTLPRTIRIEARAAVEAAGGTWVEHGAEPVIDRMVEEFGRGGRSSGAGFYDYDETGRRVGLWPGLREAFGPPRQIPFEDMKERMLFAEAIETIRCFDEGVIRSAADADIGSLLGIGFPAWTGGVVQYVESYPGGVAAFAARATELAARYGAHLAPPPSLLERVRVAG